MSVLGGKTDSGASIGPQGLLAMLRAVATAPERARRAVRRWWPARPGHPLLRARLPDRGRTITGIAGLPGQNTIPDINDYRGFRNRSQTNYDRRQKALMSRVLS